MQSENLYHQKEFSFRKKPRLSIHQLALLTNLVSDKSYTQRKSTKRKMSQIDLRTALLSKQFKQTMQIRSSSISTNNPQNGFDLQTLLEGASKMNFFSVQNYERSQIQMHNKSHRQIAKTRYENAIQKRKKQQSQDFLPPIIKIIVCQQNAKYNRALQSKTQRIENKQQKNQILTAQFDLNNFDKKNGGQSLSFLRKMKSENLAYLKNRFKLYKTNKKYPKQDEDNFSLQKPKKNNGKVKKSQKIQDQQNQGQLDKHSKKFFISNMKLDCPQNLNQIVTKKNYILKLVDKRQKQLGLKLTNGKSQPQLLYQQGQKKLLSPLTISNEHNLISKKIVSQSPDSLLMIKLNVSSSNIQKQQKYQRFIGLNRSKSIKSKDYQILKDRIIGWDTERQTEQNALNFNQYDSNH